MGEEQLPDQRGPDTFARVLRWSLLAAAVVFLAAGVYVLAQTEIPGDKQFAGFSLLLLSAVCLGSFIRDRDTKDE